jgi:hypothetical protein
MYSVSIGAGAQHIMSWDWAMNTGAYDSEYNINAMATDGAGNVYVSGHIVDTVQLGAFTLIHTGAFYERTFYLAKIDPQGNVIWAFTEGPSSRAEGQHIAVDSSNNVYVFGEYHTYATFGGSQVSTATGQSSVFLAKYNSSGAFQWVRSSTGIANAGGISLDAQQNVFITGDYINQFSFDTLTLNATLYEKDLFWIKLSPAGQLLNSYHTTSIIGEARGTDVLISSQNDVFLLGDIKCSPSLVRDIYFGSHHILEYTEGFDSFISRMDQSGNLQWILYTTGLNSQGIYYDMEIDDNDNVYVTGLVNGSLVINGVVHIPPYYNGYYVNDIVVMKVNSQGQIKWVKWFGNVSDNKGNSIKISPAGSLYVTGSAAMECVFDSLYINAIQVNPNTPENVFVVNMDTAGNVRSVMDARGLQDDGGNELSIAPGEQVYVAGNVRGKTTFGNHVVDSIHAGYISFVAKISPELGVYIFPDTIYSDSCTITAFASCANTDMNYRWYLSNLNSSPVLLDSGYYFSNYTVSHYTGWIYVRLKSFGQNAIDSVFIAPAPIVSPGTGVYETDKDVFTLYPNPASQIICLESKNLVAGIGLEVLDIAGKLVVPGFYSNDTKTNINISALSSGVYYLRVHSYTGVSSYMFVKE